MENRKSEEEKEQQKKILEESLNEIYMFDAETLCFTYVSKGALSNIGYTMEEMSAMTPLDLKPELDKHSFREILGPLKNKEKKKTVFETVHKRADQSLYPVEVHLQLVEGIYKPVYMAIILDITERKEAEKEKEHLMHVLEESLNEIYMFDAETLCFTYINKGALYNIGFTMEEMFEMTPLDIKPEFNLLSFEKMIEPLRNKEKEKIIFETVHKRADESQYDVEVHLQLVQEISKPVFLAIILDITDRKAAENKILQINESLEKKVEERTASLVAYQGQLRSLAFQLTKTRENERKRLATFLHDNLGQVLAIGKMELENIKEHKFPDSAADSLKKLEDMMNDSIRYTRELMMDLNPAPSSNQDLTSTISWITQKMKKYGLDVSVKVEGRPKRLQEEIIDVITRAVRELLYNVVKHAEINKADLTVIHLNRHVQIIVKDEGTGFAYGNMENLPEKMNGFGLFNLQEQLEWFNGSMEIISKPGEGTEVKLLVPVADKKSGKPAGKSKTYETEPVISKPDHAETDSEIKVLIADDHRLMREGLRKMIDEQDDLTVIAEASNGIEAIDLARKYSPDIIIMDINMPKMDGIVATRLIKKNDSPVRIIGLSIHKDENVARTMLNAGASTYLSKSEVFETLSATVRSEGMIVKKKLAGMPV